MEGITLQTKIADLLNDYEGMKEILIAINPKFEKLNNPILRRTLGRIASVRQAAIVGDMDPRDLVDRLRKAVGQESICENCEIQDTNCFVPEPVPRPEWTQRPAATTLNANTILDAEKNPLAEVRAALKSLGEGENLLLQADFQPEPLIEEFAKQGFDVYTHEENDGMFSTYIRK